MVRARMGFGLPEDQLFVDRQELTETYTRALDEVVVGQSRVILVEGGPGSGKSTFLHRLLQDAAARPELTPLLARCSPDEAGFDFGMVRQLVEELIRQGEGDQLPADLAWLTARIDDGARYTMPQAVSQETIHSLYWLVARPASTGPLVLAIDDVQWCDAPSLRFLTYLARRLHHVTVLIVLTHDETEQPRWGSLPAELTSGPTTVTRYLAPLDEAAIGELCQRILDTDDPEVVESCLHLTGGAPFLVTQLLTETARARGQQDAPLVQVMDGCLPSAVSRSTLNRVARLDPGLIPVLRSLSVLRSPVTLELAAQVVGQDLTSVGDAVAALQRLSVACTVHGVSIVPELVRRCVRHALEPSERHRVEARAGEALAGDDATQEAAALHLAETYPTGSAEKVEILRRAATRAAERGSHRIAGALLRRALREPPVEEQRGQVLSDLGTVELQYDGPSAAGHLRAALSWQLAPEARADCVLKLAHALVMSGQIGPAHRLLEDELDGSELPLDHESRNRLHAELWFASLGDDEIHRQVVKTRGLPPVDRPADHAPATPTMRLALSTRALSGALACEPATQVLDDAHAALSGDLMPGPNSWIGILLVGAVLLWSDDLVGAERFWAECATEARRAGATLAESVAAWLRSLGAARRGDLAAAAAYAQTSAELVADPRWAMWQLPPAFAFAETSMERGTPPNLGELLRQIGSPGDSPPTLVGHLLLAGRGRLRVTAGDVRRGLADLAEAGRHLTGMGWINPAVADWRSSAARALDLLGQRDEGLRLLEEELTLARRWGTPRPIAVALRHRAVVRQGNAGLDDATEALELIEQCAMPLEKARVLMVYAHLQCHRNGQDLARTALSEAYELAEGCGAGGLADRIRDQLLASGGRPRVRREGDGSLLTSSEARVARMAASGLTNDQIAHQLYLARRTVEAHLTNVYRKLSIRGRSQLVTVLDRIEDEPYEPTPP